MKVVIEITESDIRKVVCEKLKELPMPSPVIEFFGSNELQVKMTYRSNEAWRRPTYLRLIVEKEIAL